MDLVLPGASWNHISLAMPVQPGSIRLRGNPAPESLPGSGNDHWGVKKSCSHMPGGKGKTCTVQDMAGTGRWEVEALKSKELSKQERKLWESRQNPTGSAIHRSSRVVEFSKPTKAFFSCACLQLQPNSVRRQRLWEASIEHFLAYLRFLSRYSTRISARPLVTSGLSYPLAKSDPPCLLSSSHSESLYNLFSPFVCWMECS